MESIVVNTNGLMYRLASKYKMSNRVYRAPQDICEFTKDVVRGLVVAIFLAWLAL